MSTYLPHERLDTTSTTIGLVEGNLADDCATMLPIIVSATLSLTFALSVERKCASDILAELLDLLNFGGEVVGEGILEGLCRLG